MRKRFLLQMVCGWINKHKHSISNVCFLCVISLNKFWKFLWLGNSAWDFFPGEALPYLAYTGMCRVYNFIIERLELGVFLDWKPFKECEDLRWAVYICNTNNFFLNIYFHDFSVKNYLILYAKQTNQCQKVVSPVLNRVAKWAIFVLNRVGVWRHRRHTSSQTSLECPPGDFFEVKFWSRDFLGFWLKPTGCHIESTSIFTETTWYRNYQEIWHNVPIREISAVEIKSFFVLNLNNSQNVYKQISPLLTKHSDWTHL